MIIVPGDYNKSTCRISKLGKEVSSNHLLNSLSRITERNEPLSKEKSNELTNKTKNSQDSSGRNQVFGFGLS